MGEWSVYRPGVLLLGLQKLLEVHLQFEVAATGSLNECRTVLWALRQGGMEQRLQALPQLRSHIHFMAIAPGEATHGPSSSRAL
jgi:hypothetical protein